VTKSRVKVESFDYTTWLSGKDVSERCNKSVQEITLLGPIGEESIETESELRDVSIREKKSRYGNEPRV
jgi:hypothetical protein